MQQFNLKEWLENRDRKVQTRSRIPARIICIDKRSNNKDYNDCVVALIGGKSSETTSCYDVNGKCCSDGVEHPLDLFFIPMEYTGYIALYKNKMGKFCVGTTVYATEEEAKAQKRAKGVIKIKWEE